MGAQGHPVPAAGALAHGTASQAKPLVRTTFTDNRTAAAPWALKTASGGGGGTGGSVNGMPPEKQSQRFLAVIDAIARHPGLAVAVAVVLWLLDRLVS
jgi:hypothetical protein